MSQRDWKRLGVLEAVGSGSMAVGIGAASVGLTARGFFRLRKAFGRKGKKALAHGNRGRAPANRTHPATRKRILQLARTTYRGFNDHHLVDKLVEVEGIAVSRSTVRRLLRAEGIASPRIRRPRKHHRRRDRRAQAGQMVLWDGSRHDWLEGRGPVLCLMGAIDDATGELLPGAHFVEQECAAGYLAVLKAILVAKGVPHCIYMDRHGSLKRNDDHWSLEEQLRGEQDPTQVGRVLKELGIGPIYALTPQAKGRVERLWGTLQDRLTSELRLAKAATVEEANVVLARYRDEHNRRFAIEPADPKPAWLPLYGRDAERVCSFRYDVRVGNDNAVRVGQVVIDIPPSKRRTTFVRAKAEVRQLLDGSWRVYVDGEVVAQKGATALEEVAPARRRKRSGTGRVYREAIKKVADMPIAPKPTKPSRRRLPPPPFNAFGGLRTKRRAA